MQERQEKIVRAEGEAKAAMLLGQALKKNPGYLKLRKIRAAQAIAYTVSSGVVYVTRAIGAVCTVWHEFM